MSRKNVKESVDLNFFADYNNINVNIIQNLTDIDQRILDASTILIITIKRGFGMLFMSKDAIPIIKNDFGMDTFIQQPELIKNNSAAMMMLRSRAEYVCDLYWKDLEHSPDKEDSEYFAYYKYNKHLWQDKRKQAFELGLYGKKAEAYMALGVAGNDVKTPNQLVSASGRRLLSNSGKHIRTPDEWTPKAERIRECLAKMDWDMKKPDKDYSYKVAAKLNIGRKYVEKIMYETKEKAGMINKPDIQK
jgi:hypothetical protein